MKIMELGIAGSVGTAVAGIMGVYASDPFEFAVAVALGGVAGAAFYLLRTCQ